MVFARCEALLARSPLPTSAFPAALSAMPASVSDRFAAPSCRAHPERRQDSRPYCPPGPRRGPCRLQRHSTSCRAPASPEWLPLPLACRGEPWRSRSATAGPFPGKNYPHRGSVGRLKIWSSGSKSSSRLDSAQGHPICRTRALGGPLQVNEISPTRSSGAGLIGELTLRKQLEVGEAPSLAG
jgi:hypothetical protein